MRDFQMVDVLKDGAILAHVTTNGGIEQSYIYRPERKGNKVGLSVVKMGPRKYEKAMLIEYFKEREDNERKVEENLPAAGKVGQNEAAPGASEKG